LRKWQKFTIDCEGPEQKERKRERVRRGRRRLEHAHRRQIEPGFCGVQAHRIHSVWHSQTAHHILISYL
jgi:hypothetical protein